MLRFDRFLPLFLVALLPACGDNGSADGDDSVDPPDAEVVPPDAEDPDADVPDQPRYEFPSRYDATRDSVAYDGQVARITWIYEMSRWIDRINTDVTNGANKTDGQTVTDLNLYYLYDSTFQETPLLITTTPPTEQTTMGALSTSANLRGKLAGVEMDGTAYKDFTTGLQGWPGFTSPDALLQYWFNLLDDAAATYNPNPPLDPDGNPIPKVHVTADGLDLRELIQKFLLGAVAFYQAADDYLDDDVAGKGLLTPNVRTGENLYTDLEHAWDEGFGYFGAARDYGDYTDEELASSTAYADTDGDGDIDLKREYNAGAATNAAKRDLGAVVATDFTADAWAAFLAGRQLIADTDGELSETQLNQLRDHRDAAVQAWEKALAATVVHYINDVLKDMNAGDAYVFVDHAKHWSEMKGFALAFQFNRSSPILEEFAALHALLGTAPVLLDATSTEIEAYKVNLRMARTLIGTAYGFDAGNLGDDNGENGW